MPDVRQPVTNRHGVVGHMVPTAGYLRFLRDGTQEHGWDVFVPQCCLECDHFEQGETGEMGSHIGWPTCELNIFFPTRRGTCARQVNVLGWGMRG